MSAPRCPRCGDFAVRSSTRFGYRFDCCGLWAWGAHPLADADTHRARKAAHEAFDPLWKRYGIRRSHAYAMPADALGLTPARCHMKLMDRDTARRVPTAAEKILREHRKELSNGS